jgi:hypothetical protein
MRQLRRFTPVMISDVAWLREEKDLSTELLESVNLVDTGKLVDC